MKTFVSTLREIIETLFVWVGQWLHDPFKNLIGWGVPLVLLGAICFALPPWVGFIASLPVAGILTVKAWFVMNRIRSLEFIDVQKGKDSIALDTPRDRMQRAWFLACLSLNGFFLLSLFFRAFGSLFPNDSMPESLMTYLSFTVLLVVGFLVCYFLSLRWDKTLLRGLTCLIVTLPVFFIIVVVCCLLLSVVVRVFDSIGIPADTMLADGFVWVYNVQTMLGAATDYFLQQDPLIITVSIVFAGLLLLLYTFTVPLYQMKSVTRWMKGISLVALIFSGAVVVFAGSWVSGVQDWVVSHNSQALSNALRSDVIAQQSQYLLSYQSDDLIALIRSLVLPYTVGVFVANGVVAFRRNRAKEECDAVLDKFAAVGSVDESLLPILKKRYVYRGGNLTLWDIALRSLGNNIPLPTPFAPRRLTWKERILGDLENTSEKP